MPVRKSFSVDWTHVRNFFKVDLGENQLMVGGIYDCGPVRASEHVGDRARREPAQLSRQHSNHNLTQKYNLY